MSAVPAVPPTVTGPPPVATLNTDISKPSQSPQVKSRNTALIIFVLLIIIIAGFAVWYFFLRREGGASVDEMCATTENCAPGLFCSGTSTCQMGQSGGTAGSTCKTTQNCEQGYFCSGAATCQKGTAILSGGMCTSDSQCNTDLICGKSMTCESRSGNSGNNSGGNNNGNGGNTGGTTKVESFVNMYLTTVIGGSKFYLGLGTTINEGAFAWQQNIPNFTFNYSAEDKVLFISPNAPVNANQAIGFVTCCESAIFSQMQVSTNTPTTLTEKNGVITVTATGSANSAPNGQFVGVLGYGNASTAFQAGFTSNVKNGSAQGAACSAPTGSYIPAKIKLEQPAV